MRRILRLHLLAGALIIFFCSFVSAQDAKNIGSESSTRSEQSNTSAQTSADEVFDLNIAERRITKANYKASTEVELGDESARGVNLRVGVAVGAGMIDVLLRGVSGRVRFRATLEPLLMRIRSHRATGTTQ